MKAIGIILAGGNNKRMKELSYNRAIAAMPMVGTYRSIDFALSNMSNSRIQKVAVLTQYNTVSLNEHLNSSKLLAMEFISWIIIRFWSTTFRSVLISLLSARKCQRERI